MENISCLMCTNFATCEILNHLKDSEGRIPVQALDTCSSECKNYFNPGK